MSGKKRKTKQLRRKTSLIAPVGGETEARRGIPRWRKLYRKRGEETSSPPQKATVARLPLYSAAG
jgi:hypothetical protein